MRYWRKRAAAREMPLVDGHPPTLGLVVATYQQEAPLECLLASLRSQAYRHLRVLVVHDGPMSGAAWEAWRRGCADDERLDYFITATRADDFGHSLRPLGFQHPFLAGVDYLGSTNGDNYYAPAWSWEMAYALSTAHAGGPALAYCDCVHSHKLWQPLRAQLRRGRIDVGSWLASACLLRQTPWPDRSFAGDWSYLESLLPRVAEKNRIHVPHTLFVHN